MARILFWFAARTLVIWTGGKGGIFSRRMPKLAADGSLEIESKTDDRRPTNDNRQMTVKEFVRDARLFTGSSTKALLQLLPE